MLVEAYVVVTTNAAIATDQNGSMFWDKVRLGFIQRGGGAGRTVTLRFHRLQCRTTYGASMAHHHIMIKMLESN